MNIPVNRWSVGIVLAMAAVFGGDFVAAILRAVTAVGSIYVPAV